MTRRLVFTLDERDERRAAEITVAGVLGSKLATDDYLDRTEQGEPKVLSLAACARCDGDGHDDLAFWPLDHPVDLGVGVVLAWWALCPTSGQPILLAVVDK